MLYEEARVYLDHVSKYGSVLGLDSIKGLLEELGNPQDDLKFIHIAGTNGKGSVAAMLSKILQKSGCRTGRYISPAVMGYMERFQIDDACMDEKELPFFVEKVRMAADSIKKRYGYTATVFEIETAAAFLYFREHGCDYVVLETGLGGAEDATNVVQNVLLSIFTSISRDHMGVIGDTLEEIALTKSGIIKQGVDVVSSPQQPVVRKVLERAAARKNSHIYFVKREQISLWKESLEGQVFSYQNSSKINLPLLGRHQLENAAAVLESVERLRSRGVKIPEEAVLDGMREVYWPGRFQVLCRTPVIIVDGAHNEEAAGRLMENIRIYLSGKRVIGVMGVFRDKEYEKMTEMLAPYLEKVYTVDLPDLERTLRKEVLQECWEKQEVCAETAPDIRTAVYRAREDAKQEREGAVVVFGSLSYLGEAIRVVSEKKKRG